MKKEKKTAKKSGKSEFQKFLSSLENMILTGGFRPRERLVEANLSKMFNVSRYWVRDAFKILETKKLVTVIPFKGVVVSELSENEVQEIFAVRAHLEKMAVRLAVENVKPADITALWEIRDRLERVTEAMDVERMVEGDSDFHDFIFRLARNETLRHLINDLRNRCHLIRYSAWSSPEILKEIRKEHRLFVECLEAKKTLELEELAERHINHARDFYIFRLKTMSSPSI